MSQVGVRALKWSFTSKEAKKYINSLESYKQIYTLAFLADQTWVLELPYVIADSITDKLHNRGIVQNISQKMNSFVDKKIIAKLPVAKGTSFELHIEE